MDASKKQFTYIKNGELLREQEGLNAKVEHEADELFNEIIGEIGPDAENKPDKPAVTKTDDEISQLLIEVCNAFLKGPLSSKPKEELYSGNSCSSGISKVHGLTESARETKCHIGKTEVAEAEYEASVSGADSVLHAKEKKEESAPGNSRKYSYGISKVGTSAESAGKANFQIGKTEVANAEYEASVSGAASVSHTKERKVESSSHNSYKYSSTTSKVEASGELKGESQGQVTAGRGKNKVGANYCGRLNLQGNAGASVTKMQKEWRAKNGERKGSVKVAEAKVEAQAKAEMHGKVEIGGSKKSGIKAELQAKATSNAEVVGLYAKADLAVRKKEKMGYYVPGAEIICGKGHAEATAEFDFKSDKFGDKKGEAKAKVKVECVRARSLGVDVQAEEECMKPKADLGIRMAEIKAGNAKVVGRKKGTDVGIEAKVRGFELNAFNAEITGIDNSTKAKVEKEAGTFVNIGNIQVTGLGSTGAHCKGDATAGVSVGNVAVGISRETGIETPNHQKAYGNVNLMLGPPSLPPFNAGGNFNIGIPFFSAGGRSGGGGGGNDGTNAYQTASRYLAGNQSGEASGCECKSAAGECNTTAQGGSVNNSGGHTDPSAGMNHDAGQRGNYGNCDYGSRSGSHTGPQTVTDEQSGGVYGYGYGSASDEGVYSEAGKKGSVVERRSGHTTAVSRGIDGGIDHDASQKGSSESHGSMGREGVYTQIALAENFTQSKAGRTAAGNGRGVDRDASQPGNNGSFFQHNDTEMNGEDRGNTAGYVPASKIYAINSEAGGLSGAQTVDGSSATHSDDIQIQATGYGDNGNCGVNNALTDHRSAHTYTERLMVLADKKMAKKFGESTAPRQRRNEAKSSRRADSIDKEQIKKYLTTTYTPASCSGSGKTNQRSTTEEADRAMYSPEDEKHPKSRKKVPSKKPFGEKKNIHTIFTLSEGDTRPIKHIKGNVVCFGDE